MTSEPERTPKRWLRRLLYTAGIAAVVLIAAVVIALRVGQWLVVEDPLGQADVIVVLSGRMPSRALGAAKIYEQGFAARVWVPHSQGPEEELRKMGIPYVGEEFYTRRVLMAQTVPPDAIRVLDKVTGNTEDELREVMRLMREEGVRTAIVVTSKPHTRRVRAIWKRLASAKAGSGEGPRMIVRYAAGDSYDGAHWWRSTRDALDVLREVFGLMNVWAGFPVRYAAR
jgi:uncharacterized SAM-binding protein YcdF (DUF218 family)